MISRSRRAFVLSYATVMGIFVSRIYVRPAYAVAAPALKYLIHAGEQAKANVEKLIKTEQVITLACIAYPLDTYAQEVNNIAPLLPPSVRGVASILTHVAGGVHSARTEKQASEVIQDGIVQIRKTIELIRAEDPDSSDARLEAGSIILTLGYMDRKLLTAEGI